MIQAIKFDIPDVDAFMDMAEEEIVFMALPAICAAVEYAKQFDLKQTVFNIVICGVKHSVQKFETDGTYIGYSEIDEAELTKLGYPHVDYGWFLHTECKTDDDEALFAIL